MTAHLCKELDPTCYRCDLNRDEMAASEADVLREAAREIRIDAVNGSTRFLAAISQWLLAQSGVPVSYGHPANPNEWPPRISGPDPHALAVARAWLDENED